MSRKRLPLLSVPQWQNTWNLRDWSAEGINPPHEFFVASFPIQTLRRLAGVRRRDIELRKKEHPAPGHQRGHDGDRSEKIYRYMQYGYPLSRENGLEPEKHTELVNPGWLPTSILINIINENECRYIINEDVKVKQENIVTIVQHDGQFYVEFPEEAERDGWEIPENELQPLEIIDGQHRLFAVEPDEELKGDYNVPVIFFNGLPQQLQAYLFWVINVEPVKINTSLAFDLYPDLRNQEWLEQGEWIKVYQEHRAQELTEVLWRHPDSPWRDRIEVHGKRIEGHVSNAAFIRSLMSSFVRKWGTNSGMFPDHLERIGGLFGSIDKEGKSYVIQWKRSQQAAFLIRLWSVILEVVGNSHVAWIEACAKSSQLITSRPGQNPYNLHPGFAGPYSLLGTDQGVRAVLVVSNAIFQVENDRLNLNEWASKSVTEPSNEAVTLALAELDRHEKIIEFIYMLADALINGGQDWRTSSEPILSETEKMIQGAYRGSSGYKLLIENTIKNLMKSEHTPVQEAAIKVSSIMGIEE